MRAKVFLAAAAFAQIAVAAFAQTPQPKTFTLTLAGPEVDLDYRALKFYGAVLDEASTTPNPAVELLIEKLRQQVTQELQPPKAEPSKAESPPAGPKAPQSVVNPAAAAPPSPAPAGVVPPPNATAPVAPPVAPAPTPN